MHGNKYLKRVFEQNKKTVKIAFKNLFDASMVDYLQIKY